MEKKKFVKYAWRAILTLFLLIISFGTTMALLRSGPRQLEKKSPKELSLTARVILTRESRTELLRKELKRLPRFTPPENGIITSDQMERYVNIVYCVQAIQAGNLKRRPKIDLSLSGALLLMRFEMSLVMLIEEEQHIKYKMNYEEFRWIDTNIKKALALAMKRLVENCYKSETPPEVKRLYENAAIMGNYSAKDETGSVYAKPELIDPSEIPEAHYRYVVSYYKWLKYNDLDFEKADFQCLVDRDKIQPAHFRPSEVIYPEVK